MIKNKLFFVNPTGASQVASQGKVVLQFILQPNDEYEQELTNLDFHIVRTGSYLSVLKYLTIWGLNLNINYTDLAPTNN